MRHRGQKTVSSEREGEGGGHRARARRLTVTVAVGAFMLIAAVGWACTASQMKGELWFSGSTGANVLATPGANLGSCPVDADQDVRRGYATGDVVCVQASDLKVTGTGSIRDPEDREPSDPLDGGTANQMRFYELKYTPTTSVGGNVDNNLCHNSRKTLPNLNTEHGLYVAKRGVNSLDPGGGWIDQQTVLDMPGGSYTVCAASANPPAAGVMGPVAVGGTGWYDAGPDGDTSTDHLQITVTGPPSNS